jgi:hypothetical protein
MLDPMPREDVKLPPPAGYVTRADYDAALARAEKAEANAAEMEAEAHAHIELWGKAIRERNAALARADHSWKMVAEADTLLGQSLGEAIQDKREIVRLLELLRAALGDGMTAQQVKEARAALRAKEGGEV